MLQAMEHEALTEPHYLPLRVGNVSFWVLAALITGELWTCLTKIQKDDKNADVYAKNPHGLTHFPDALRYFCVWWTSPAKNPVNIKKRPWTADMYEDYRNANAEERKMLMERWGHPA